MSAACDSIEHALDGMMELRPFPAAAARLMSACSDESANVRDITEIIKYDAGLSIQLLKIANSPMYGFSGEIRSIDHATVVLGMRALRDLAVSTAMGDVFNSGSRATEETRSNLWRHSMISGCIARLLAEKVEDVVPEEAFLGGVIHDVGKLFLLDHDADGYTELLDQCSLHQLATEEQKAYGLPHTVIGQRCGQNWGLPEEIIDVISFHHDPEDADFGGSLVDVVFASNHLAVSWFEETETDLSDADALTRARLDLGSDVLQQIRDTSVETIQVMSDICC